MKHDSTYKLDIGCIACMDSLLKHLKHKKLLLDFVKTLSLPGEILGDIDDLWNTAETIQDGIDYADHTTAKSARELLRKIEADND